MGVLRMDRWFAANPSLPKSVLVDFDLLASMAVTWLAGFVLLAECIGQLPPMLALTVGLQLQEGNLHNLKLAPKCLWDLLRVNN